MLDLTKPLQTRDGRKAVFLSKGSTSFIALVAKGEHDKTWQEICFSLDGYHKNNSGGTMFQVINAPVKHKLTGFLNVYESGNLYGYQNKDRSDDHAHFSPSESLVACIDLSKLDYEFEEGEGIEKPGD